MKHILNFTYTPGDGVAYDADVMLHDDDIYYLYLNDIQTKKITPDDVIDFYHGKDNYKIEIPPEFNDLLEKKNKTNGNKEYYGHK